MERYWLSSAGTRLGNILHGNEIFFVLEGYTENHLMAVSANGILFAGF